VKTLRECMVLLMLVPLVAACCSHAQSAAGGEAISTFGNTAAEASAADQPVAPGTLLMVNEMPQSESADIEAPAAPNTNIMPVLLLGFGMVVFGTIVFRRKG
jgi:hypothetical protein